MEKTYEEYQAEIEREERDAEADSRVVELDLGVFTAVSNDLDLHCVADKDKVSE